MCNIYIWFTQWTYLFQYNISLHGRHCWEISGQTFNNKLLYFWQDKLIDKSRYGWHPIHCVLQHVITRRWTLRKEEDQPSQSSEYTLSPTTLDWLTMMKHSTRSSVGVEKMLMWVELVAHNWILVTHIITSCVEWPDHGIVEKCVSIADLETSWWLPYGRNEFCEMPFSRAPGFCIPRCGHCIASALQP